MENTMLRNPATIKKKYYEYFIPTVLTVMAINISTIVDSIIAGNLLGGNCLAAINLTGPITQLFFALTIMFGLGASSAASVYKGKNDNAGANSVFTCAFILILATSFICMGVIFGFLNQISNLLTKDPDLTPLIPEFLTPLVGGLPVTLLLLCSIYFIRLDAKPKLATRIIIIANFINLACDLLYMGVLKMGIFGAGLATITGNAVGFCMALAHFMGKSGGFRLDFSVLKKIKDFFRSAGGLLTVGLSAATGTLLISVKMIFLNSLVLHSGESEAMVSFSVCLSMQMLISMFISGASQTMIPIIGVCLGEKDYSGIRYAFKTAVRILFIAAAAIIVFLLFETEFVIRIFGITSASDIANTIPAVRLTSFSLMGMSFVFLHLYYYLAIQKKFMSMMISVLHEIVIIIPVAILMEKEFGLPGLWLSLVIDDVLTLLAVYIVAFINVKKSKGKYKGFYLLEQKDTNELIALSVKATVANAAGIAAYLEKVLKANGVEDKIVNRAAMSVEEFTVAAAANSLKKQSDIDIRVLKDNEDIIISIRDNGKELNPLDHKEDGELTPLKTLMSVAKSIEYSRVIGFNRIIVKI